MDTRGVELYDGRGDPSTCQDVIYTVDSRLPSDDGSVANASWGALSFAVDNFPAFNSTCAAYFRIFDTDDTTTTPLHPVWGRLPATALAMSSFPNAKIFLYLDTDAMLSSSRHSPRPKRSDWDTGASTPACSSGDGRWAPISS